MRCMEDLDIMVRIKLESCEYGERFELTPDELDKGVHTRTIIQVNAADMECPRWWKFMFEVGHRKRFYTKSRSKLFDLRLIDEGKRAHLEDHSYR